MKIILVLLVAVSVVSAFNIMKEQLPQGVNWPFAVCGNGTWTMKNLTLGHAPSRNADDNVDAFGIANDDTQFSKVDILVKLNGLFLHGETVDFVKSYDSGDVIEYEYKTFIPSFAPAGTYVMQFTYKTPSGKQNGCWSFSFKL